MTAAVFRSESIKKQVFRQSRSFLPCCMRAENSAGGGYKVSGGLHGVGASVVNALSTWLEVEICHDGKIYQQRYERGKVMEKLTVIGECDPEKTGTKVTFQPDPEIFEDTVYDFDVLKQRLREMAFLTKNIRIVLPGRAG